MIIGLFHPGSGCGDQLFCYLAARITSERLGVPFTMVGDFKGDSFMELDKGVKTDIPNHVEYPAGKIAIENNWPVYEGRPWYDPEFNFIEDDTIVDGCRLQDERYWEGYPLHEWLRVEPLVPPDDVCIIGFRGGEYYADPKLGLPREYYWEAMDMMQRKNPSITFEVHTDDKQKASELFAGLSIIQDIGTNWRSVRYAKNLIIANSAFYILPSLLNQRADTIIAPRYWARRNIKEWSTVQNYYPKFQYI